MQVAVDFRGRVNNLYGGCGIYAVIRMKTKRVGLRGCLTARINCRMTLRFTWLLVDTEKRQSRWSELPHGLRI
jgi:hypothetical protein